MKIDFYPVVAASLTLLIFSAHAQISASEDVSDASTSGQVELASTENPITLKPDHGNSDVKESQANASSTPASETSTPTEEPAGDSINITEATDLINDSETTDSINIPENTEAHDPLNVVTETINAIVESTTIVASDSFDQNIPISHTEEEVAATTTSVAPESIDENPTISYTEEKEEKEEEEEQEEEKEEIVSSTVSVNDLAATVKSDLEDSTAIGEVEKVEEARDFEFRVYDQTQIACTLLSMDLALKTSFTSKDNETVKLEVSMPRSAQVSGNCGANLSYVTLSWPANSPPQDQHRVSLEMVKDHQVFYVNSISAQISLQNEELSSSEESNLSGNSSTGLKLFSASVKDGIHVCNSETEVQCGKIVVAIKSISLIAYNDREDISNRKGEACLVPKTVSIAAIVGTVIGAIIAVGIVASLVLYKKKSNSFRSELP